jgi:DNA-binding transcriptional MocR family regulator
MDVDGRVLRYDSLSKLLSSGLRLGMVTGPEALVTRIALHMQATELHCSGVSQAVAAALFEHWRTASNGGANLGFTHANANEKEGASDDGNDGSRLE